MEENTTQTTTPPVQPVETKKVSTLMIAVGVIFVILLSAIGYLAYQNMQLQNEIANLKTDKLVPPTYSPTPVATTDPTANWKTYSGNGFSFSYPQDFTIFDGSIDLSEKSSVVQMNIDAKNKGSYGFDSFLVWVVKSSQSLDNYVNESESKDKNVTPIVGHTNEASMQWLGFYKNAPTHYAAFAKNGYIYIMGLIATEDSTRLVDGNIQLLDQILSTFKFTK